MQSTLRRVINGFRGNPAASAQMLRDLYEKNTAAFVAASQTVLKEDLDAAGMRYLLTQLLRDGVILRWLCDPAIFSTRQAIRIVEVLCRIDARVDVRLMALAFPVEQESGRLLDEPGSLRVLELASALGGDLRFLPMVARLMRHDSPKVRSKAALIVGRGNKNPKWVFRQLSGTDGRLRANAIESLWGVQSADARAVLWSALSDTDNRAVGNAILGLYRQGEAASIGLLLQMADHPDARFRETGIWIMEQTGDVRFTAALTRMMAERPEHRGNILRALNTLKRIAATRAEQPRLRLVLNRVECNAETESTVMNVVPLSKSGSVAGLLPTQFSVWTDSTLVTDYEVEPIAMANAVAVACIVPRSLDRPSSEQLVMAVRGALRYRRPADAWSVVKYRARRPAAAMAASPHSRFRTATLGLEVETMEEAAGETEDGEEPGGAAFRPRILFCTDNDTIEDMLLAAGTHESSAPDVCAAVAATITAMPATRQQRFIWLLLDAAGEDTSVAEVDRLAAMAQRNGTTIHTLAPRDSAFGRALAAATGGHQIPFCSPDQFEAALESLSTAIGGGYQVRFKGAVASPASLQLQVQTQEAWGEVIHKM